MNKIQLLVVLFFMGCTQVFSQSVSRKSMKVTSEELALAKKLHKQFPEDDVVLNYKNNLITFDYSGRHELVTATNELEESYVNAVNHRSEIHVYEFYDGKSEIKDFSAKRSDGRTDVFYNPEDEPYTSQGLFHQDVRVKHGKVDFPIQGCTNYVDITTEYDDLKYFTKIFFTGSYPVVTRKITFDVPDWLEIEFKEMNFEGYDISKEVIDNGNSTTYIYTATNLPSNYKDDHALGATYLYPHLLLLPKAHTKEGAPRKLFETTQDLYNWYASLVGELENNRAPLKGKVAELTSNATSDEEKIKNIFYWVQDNIRYIAFEDGIAGFKPDEAANVFEKRYGDCKGMANLTKQMLIEAGFDARLCWIGTKHIAYDYSTPSLSVDNHMICAVNLDGEYLFLDGTEDFNAFGEYAYRIQGKQVLIENGSAFDLQTVPETDFDFNKNVTDYELSLSETKLQGNIHKELYGQARTSILQYFNTLKTNHKEDFLKYYLGTSDNSSTIDNVVTSDLTNRDIPIDVTYDVEIDNFVTPFDADIYVGLEFENPYLSFDFSERKTDYCFSYKRDLESSVTLAIPEGYKVSYIPEAISVSNSEFDAAVGYELIDKKLVYTKKFHFKTGTISTSNFNEWNTFYDQLKNIYQEQIVLTKL